MNNQELLHEIYEECRIGIQKSKDEEIKTLFQSIGADVIELAMNLGIDTKIVMNK